MKLLSQTETKKTWVLDDGRRVDVFNDYDRCVKCGRPLRSKYSRIIGKGHKCLVDSRMRGGILVIIKKDGVK